jgi:phosphoglucomutase
MMHKLEQTVTSPGYVGTQLSHKNKSYIVKLADNFHYEDPVDGSIAEKQVCSAMPGTIHQPFEVCTKT